MVAFASLMKRWVVGAFAAYMGYHASDGGSCDVSEASLYVPSNQSSLKSPTNLTVSFIGVGFGVQNYTCSPYNNYTSLGAFAELFDISCLYGTKYFNTVQDDIYGIWTNFSASITIPEIIEILPYFYGEHILAQHFFQPNKAGPGLSPVWRFASEQYKDNPNAYFVGKPIVTYSDPYNSTFNIPWLQVAHVDGAAADMVYRTRTVGGQPPTSCTHGTSQNISVKYSSQYWFYGGALLNYTSHHHDHSDHSDHQ